LKYNNCNCNSTNENLPNPENIMPFSNLGCNTPSCNMPIKRHLQPVLIAKIYNQPIIEEIPFSAMSLTLDNTATVSNAYSDMKPNCVDGCNDGYNYPL